MVPYEGPNGTFRRPIYVECVENEVILQPEGVRISRDDLRPPYGPGNPLAAALALRRDHFVRLHPNEGQSRDTEPYPLLLVRPDGLLMYDRARKAIEAGDFDFGFELVEADWKLKYPAADPQLAGVEQQAIEQARVRQEVLAAAAPRAYRHPALAAAGEFEFEDERRGGMAADWFRTCTSCDPEAAVDWWRRRSVGMASDGGFGRRERGAGRRWLADAAVQGGNGDHGSNGGAGGGAYGGHEQWPRRRMPKAAASGQGRCGPQWCRRHGGGSRAGWRPRRRRANGRTASAASVDLEFARR